MDLCLGARRWHHSARARVECSTQCEEVETRGQAAETGNLFAPVGSLPSSPTAPDGGGAGSVPFWSGREPALCPHLLNQWGVPIPSALPESGGWTRFGTGPWACHFPPPLSAWRWALTTLSPVAQTFPFRAAAATAFLSCLQAHLTRFLRLCPLYRAYLQSYLRRQNGFRFCSFLCSDTQPSPLGFLQRAPSFEFLYSFRDLLTVSKEFYSLKHV